MTALESWPDTSPASTTTAPRRLLLSTKLYPPRTRRGLVARARLLDLFDGAGSGRLVVVRAPAGYGKSTLVAQWLAQAGAPVAWVSLDAGDDDPWSFFALVTAAIDSIDRGLVAGTQALLDGAGDPTAQSLARSLVTELSTTTRPFVLVLDDYHLIESPEIHQSVALLMNHLPPAMRVVLVTRTEPPLPLARLRASGEVLELDQADLRFTSEEALKLYHESLDLDLTPGEVEALLARSEGWVAALQLIGISLRGQPRERLQRFAAESSGNARFVDDYLWEEILQPLPEDLRAFLLRTSILDRFNADLCGVVAETANAAQLIQRVDRANLFLIPLDDRGEWFRYHHLLLDALRDRLAQVVSDDEARRRHVRAAEWLEAHDLIEEAVRHAVAGADWDRAVRLLERIGVALFENDRVIVLRSWLEGLPPAVFDRSPRLAFWLAWSLARLGDFSGSLPLLKRAQDAWTDAGDRADSGLIRILSGFGHVTTGDHRQVIEGARAALDLLPAERRGDRAIAQLLLGVGYLLHGVPDDADRAFADARVALDGMEPSWLHLIEMTNSASVLVLRGSLREASVLLRRVVRTGDHQQHPVAQNSLFQLANIYLEWDMLDDAERCLRRAAELAEATKSILFGNRIHLGLAHLAWAQGEVEDAFDALERAVEAAGQASMNQHGRDTRAQQARFWLASNQVALARRWAASAGLDPSQPPEYERQEELLTLVRLQVLDGQPDLAIRLLDAVQDLAEATGRSGDVVEMLVLRALAHKAGGDNPAALAALDRALALGTPAGYVRTFADEGEVLAPLLRHAAARSVHREYAQRLLTAIEGGPAALLPDQAGLTEALSDRELEVLRLVAAGLPNREIGQRLYISEKTVKKHLSNLMGKLETTNRTQAVDQARRLGLL